MNGQYVLITAAKDEEACIAEVIQSVLNGNGAAIGVVYHG